MTKFWPQSPLKPGSETTARIPHPLPSLLGFPGWAQRSFLKTGSMQPWRRLEKVEGAEARDDQGVGLPDPPKDTSQREDREEDSNKQEGSPEALNCAEKEVKASVMSLFRPPLKESGRL